MPLLALAIGEPADRQQIRRLEQAHAVVETQALAGVELVGDVGEAGGGETGASGSALAIWLIGVDADTRFHDHQFVIRDAEDLDAERARARAVELGHQDALPLAEHDFAAADLQRQVVAEQQRAQVRIGVHAIAVGMIRIVVHPLGVARDHLLEEPLDVGEQRRLELVDEERAGRVHRPEADQAFADVEAPDELHDAVGEIDELDALVGRTTNVSP